jgi:general secretion pathway protein J
MKVSSRGFTLIEMLVAIAIFAVASALAYGGLNTLVNARAQIDNRNDRLGRLQFAIGLIERDLRSIADRPVRENFGAERPALDGQATNVELTRFGNANSLGLTRAELERVAYRLDDGVLQRRRYAVLDRAPGSLPDDTDLLDGIERFELRYRAADGRELRQWPPPRSDDTLPRAVEIRIAGDDIGEIRRLLELPEPRR